MKREDLERRLNDVEALITESKDTVQSYKKERKQLKKQLEELPKLEVGKWYKFDLSLMFVKNKPTNNNVIGYGFDGTGLWTDKYHYWESYKDNYRPATDKEVQTALIAEAKKRGFKEGGRFKGVAGTQMDEDVQISKHSPIEFGFPKSSLGLYCQNSWIFRKGKWATIIKDKTIHLNGDYTKQDLEKIIQTEFNQ